MYNRGLSTFQEIMLCAAVSVLLASGLYLLKDYELKEIQPTDPQELLTVSGGGESFGAPSVNVTRHLEPSTDDTYNLGSSTGPFYKGIYGSSTLQVKSLASCDTVDTDANGVFSCGIDSGAELSTSTPIADTEVLFATAVNTLGSEAAFIYDDSTNKLTFDYGSTTALTATNFHGALVGNADTATALVANGGNCAAGEIPLGVDASGAVEGCYEPTEADITDLTHYLDTDVSSYLYGSTTRSELYTDGNGLTWTGTTLDFDGGATPAGDLGGTWANPSVDDDSHNHVYSNIDAFTEVNLYSILSDVTQFYESGDEDTIVGAISEGALANDSIVEADLKAVDAAADEECLTYETTTGDFEWQTCGAGGLFSDGGDITYLTSTTDDLALGGTTATSSFFFDVGASTFTISSTTSATGSILFDHGGVTYGSSTLETFYYNFKETNKIIMGSVTGVTDLVVNFGMTVLDHLTIPQGTNPTIDAAGEIGVNTGTSSLLYHDGTAERQLKDEWAWGSSFASTSLAFDGAYAADGTTTVPRAGFKYPITVTEYWCQTNKGTVWMKVGNGTATSSPFQCDEDGTSTTTGNNSFNVRERILIDIGTQSGDPDRILFDATTRWTVQ